MEGKKTILVQITNEERASGVIDIAVGLGKRLDGVVEGIYVVPSMETLTALVSGGAGPMVTHDRRSELIEVANRCEMIFIQALDSTVTEGFWSTINSGFESVGVETRRRAGACDVVVVSQIRGNEDTLFASEIPERLILESGRPVVIVPERLRTGWMPERILVAWDGTREANRAVSDALSLLQGCRELKVVRFVEGPGDESVSQDCRRFESWLKRHGIRVLVNQIIASGEDIGASVDAIAQETGSDLVVAGGYGDSRLKQSILGGVTRYLLRRGTVPLFMSH